MVALGGGSRLVEAGYASECSADQLAAANLSRAPQRSIIIKIPPLRAKSMLSVEQAVVVARRAIICR